MDIKEIERGFENGEYKTWYMAISGEEREFTIAHDAIGFLLSTIKSLQAERDKYKEALLSIVNYDDGLIRMHEELGELVTIYERIAQSALKEEPEGN